MRVTPPQSVLIYGHACTLRPLGRSYVVKDESGRVIGRAPTRFLAIARAAKAFLE